MLSNSKKKFYIASTLAAVAFSVMYYGLLSASAVMAVAIAYPLSSLLVGAIVAVGAAVALSKITRKNIDDLSKLPLSQEKKESKNVEMQQQVVLNDGLESNNILEMSNNNSIDSASNSIDSASNSSNSLDDQKQENSIENNADKTEVKNSQGGAPSNNSAMPPTVSVNNNQQNKSTTQSGSEGTPGLADDKENLDEQNTGNNPFSTLENVEPSNIQQTDVIGLKN